MRTVRPALTWALLLVSSLPGQTAPGSAETVTAVSVYPPEVRLETSRDRQSVVVQATLEDGTTRDVTAEARLTVRPEALARVDAATLLPATDGEGSLRVEYGGREVDVPLLVADAAAERPISFRLDVMPVFTRSGCNSGSCHGASRGKDGFRLSLFGFDPDGDHHRLTRELAGRRLDLAVPGDSLLLRKATGEVLHTGGTCFEEGSEAYATLIRWLEARAPADSPEVAAPTGVSVWPREAVLAGEGTSQRLTVRATYSDGTDRDVTSLSYFLTTNSTAAEVTPDGSVHAGSRGESFIMVRFATFVTRMRVIVLPSGGAPPPPPVAARNYIDERVHEKLRKLRIRPSDVATDEVFLRRVFLDVTGKLPSVEERERFLASEAPDKRERLVDELLGRKEFAELWCLRLAELLRIRSSQQVSYKATLLYHGWLRRQIEENVPLDRIVASILGSSGGTFENPPTNFYQSENDTLKVAENVAQAFLGTRIQCAQCHNHPFDRWTQDDYYGFAAFFARIGRKRGADPRETIIFDRGGGEVRHPVTKQVARPRFLGGEEPDLQGRARREALAEWLVSTGNPAFARNAVNVIWASFFGRGIVHEVDDVRVSNPPSNEPLLDELARRFVDYGYDVRRLVRDICVSRTYQLSTRANETNGEDETNFSRARVRRLRAEVLHDVISQVTDTQDKFRGLPLGARAVQIADGATTSYFLTTFGRASRQTVCSCEVKTEPNLSQALHLLNGQTVERKIRQGGLVRRLLEEGSEPMAVVDEIWRRTLCRAPTDEERSGIRTELEASPGQTAPVLEDVFWSVLNSREFIFNH